MESTKLARLLPQKADRTLWHESITFCYSDFAQAAVALRRFSYHVWMVWLRTFANGWTISCRLRCSQIWPCIFCKADARYTLLHYLSCHVLSSWVQESVLSPLSSDLRVLFVVSPCVCLTLRFLFVNFIMYRSVRHDYHTMSRSPERWRAACKNTFATGKFELLVASASLSI